MNYKLKIVFRTWNKDSNLLFDYESSDYTANELNLSSTGILTKRDKNLHFNSRTEKKIADYVGSISCKDDEYNLSVEPEFEGSSGKERTIDDKLWIVIKSTVYKGNTGYRLREGDVIKFGKVMFKVRELKSEKKVQNSKSKNAAVGKDKTLGDINNINNEINIVQPAIKKNNNRMASAICRICLMDDNENDNPLINPCQCIGSVRFIHLACIRQWLKCKITTKVFNFLTVHSFKSFECELCKTAVSEKIKFRNEIISLIDYDKPETNFIMLESITREVRETKYLYIIHMRDKTTIQLGRSNDSDVRMTDISVSRNHALLKLVEGEFYIEDNSSKFGTLVQMQNDVLIIPYKQISIQSGKICMVFLLTKTCLAWMRCYLNIKLCNMDYNEYFEHKSLLSNQEELANIKIINTDYTIYSDYNSNIKMSLNDKMSKGDFKHLDKLVYQNTKMDIKDWKEVKENDSINFKTYQNDVTSNKLVLTENCIYEERLNKDKRVAPTNSSMLNVSKNNINYKPILNASVSVLNYINNEKDSMNLLASYSNSNNEILIEKNNLGLVNKNVYNSNQSKPSRMESSPNVEVNAPLSSKNKKGDGFFRDEFLKKLSVQDTKVLNQNNISIHDFKLLTNIQKNNQKFQSQVEIEKFSSDNKQLNLFANDDINTAHDQKKNMFFSSDNNNKLYHSNPVNTVSYYDSNDNVIVKAMIDNIFGNINYTSNPTGKINNISHIINPKENDTEIENNYCITKSDEKSFKLAKGFDDREQMTFNDENSNNSGLRKPIKYIVTQPKMYLRNQEIVILNSQESARKNSISSIKSENDIIYSRRSRVNLLDK